MSPICYFFYFFSRLLHSSTALFFCKVGDITPVSYTHLAVAEETDLPVVPNWAPNDTKLVGAVSMIKRTDGNRIQAVYSVNGERFTVRIQIYDSVPDVYTGIYQKDSSEEIVEYKVSDITHYLMNNNGHLLATWVNENIECCLLYTSSIWAYRWVCPVWDV